MSVTKLIPYVERTLAEYSMIFPNVESLLQHHFNVIGNGYSWSSVSHVPVDEGGCIDQYPPLTETDRESIRQKIIDKIERRHVDSINMTIDIWQDDPVRLSKRLTDLEIQKQKSINNIPIRVVDEAEFTFESLLNQISKDENGEWIPLRRPYSLSDFSAVNHISKDTPQWLLQVVINFYEAWKSYLSTEISLGNYDDREYESTSLEKTKQLIIEYTSLIERLKSFQVADATA